MRAATPYRSIDDDVEEAAVAGTRSDEKNDITFDASSSSSFGTAGRKKPTMMRGTKTILATLGAVALVGFGTATTAVGRGEGGL